MPLTSAVIATSPGPKPQRSDVGVGKGVEAGVRVLLLEIAGVLVLVAGLDGERVGGGLPERLTPSVGVDVAERLRGPALVARGVGVMSGVV